MRKPFIFVIPVLALFFASCGDDGTGPNGDETGEHTGLAVRAVNTGSDTLEIETRSPISITFCYAESGCEATSGGSFHSIFEGQSSLIDTSRPDSTTVGVQVNFIVTSGQGQAEIVRGDAYRSEAGFLEFDAVGPVVHTSATFAAGDTVRFTYGETD